MSQRCLARYSPFRQMKNTFRGMPVSGFRWFHAFQVCTVKYSLLQKSWTVLIEWRPTALMLEMWRHCSVFFVCSLFSPSWPADGLISAKKKDGNLLAPLQLLQLLHHCHHSINSSSPLHQWGCTGNSKPCTIPHPTLCSTNQIPNTWQICWCSYLWILTISYSDDSWHSSYCIYWYHWF